MNDIVWDDEVSWDQPQAEPQARVDPTEGMSGTDRFLAGAGKAFMDAGRGVGQLTGLMSQADVDEAKRLDADLMNTGAGVAGNVLGNVAATAPALFVPGAATIRGGALLGSALGASQPVASGDSRTANALLGAAGGGVGGAINRGLTRVVNPNTSPEVRQLLKEGVRLTPGQVMGGFAKSVEDKLTSVPILGDAIVGAQRRAVESVNKAAFQRALDPIGERFTGNVGREGVAEVQQKLGAAYDKLLPNLTFKADKEFAKDLLTIRSMTKQLPPQQAKQFQTIFQQQLIGKMTPNGLMNGASFKEVESQLLREARGYAGSADFDQRKLGAAIGELVESLKSGLARANPAQAKELNAINRGWANYARIRGAAGSTGAKEGIFTPAQLASAVRSQDKSVGKGAFAQGRALMQDLTDPAQKVVGSNYPDSGTAGRLLNAGALASGFYHPAIPAALLGGAVPYTGLGQRVTAALLAKRPASAKALAEALERASPAMAVTGATVAQ